MTLGTLNSDTHEELGRGFDGILWIATDPVVIRSWILEGRAICRQKLTNKLIHRLVCLKTLADPSLEDIRTLDLNQTCVGTQDVGQFQCPEVIEFVACQELVDQLGTLVCRLVGHENGSLFNGRQHANHVKENPSQKLFVGTSGTRSNPHPVQLGQNCLINQVIRRNSDWCKSRDFHKMRQPDNRDQVLVVGNNGRFTGRFEADESVGVHIGDFRCRAVVIGQWSHIA